LVPLLFVACVPASGCVGGNGQVTVFQGYNAAIFTLYDTHGQDPLEAGKALAAKALPRL
jgi:hypothetical protein